MLEFKNKRGELSDIFVFVITLFILGVGFLILLYVTPQIIDGLRIGGLNESAQVSAVIDQTESIMTNTISNGFLILFVGMILLILITSFLVRTHPIFLFLYILFMAVAIILAVYLGNAYYDLQTNPIFTDILDDASIVNTILNHIVEITVAVGLISIIIIFSKFSSAGGSQEF